MLDYVAEHLKGVRLLEVEPTEDEMTTRRVNYYRRNGYEVLDKLMCSLLIMRWKMLVRFGLWEVKILPGWLSR